MSNISTQNVDDLLFKIFSQTLCPCPVYHFSRANILPSLYESKQSYVQKDKEDMKTAKTNKKI